MYYLKFGLFGTGVAKFLSRDIKACPLHRKVKKASFIKRPSDPYDERMQKLYEIRPYRRITQDDIDEHFPGWNMIEHWWFIIWLKLLLILSNNIFL